MVNGAGRRVHAERGIMEFAKPKRGEWVQPIKRGYRLACCDCGLVHILNFRVVKYADGKRVKIQFQAFRDDKETKALRKKERIRVRV